jgi:thiamine pyrophosphokinase
MRALLVCPISSSGSPALVGELASACDVVIAVDGGAELCASAGVMPDLAVGDFDSAAPGTLGALRDAGVEVVTFPAEKDATDLELALATARSRGATEVLIAGAVGGRLDHMLAVVGALARERSMRPELVETDIHCWLLAADARSSISLAGDGALVSAMAVAGPAVVTVTGTKWELEAARLEPLAGLGVSNVLTAGTATVEVAEGVVLVVSASEGGSMIAEAVGEGR